MSSFRPISKIVLLAAAAHAQLPQCTSYESVPYDQTRKYTQGGIYDNCDQRRNGLFDPVKYYRFQDTSGAGFDFVQNSNPSTFKCGTTNPGWIRGAFPTEAEGEKQLELCFSNGAGANLECYWGSTPRVALVTQCKGFYVYKFPTYDTLPCFQRMCTTNVAPADFVPPGVTTKNIFFTAVDDPELSTLVAVLTMADYKPVLDALSGAGPFTVFAPTNAAFAAAGVDTTDVDAVTAILQYHVVGSQILSTDLKAGSNFADSLQGTSLRVNVDGSVVQVNAKATVTTADVLCTNGVIHIVDAVIAPIPLTIVENAAENPELATLVAVLTMYKPVLDALSGAGPFTVFAPNNAAFAASSIDITDITAVTAVLQYHVIATGAVYAGDLMATQSVATLYGKSMTITKDGTGVMINSDASVVTADVQSSNGVIHVIDKVLITPTFSPTFSPSFSPTSSPSFSPTFSPSSSPTFSPSSSPTFFPSASPSQNPSSASETTSGAVQVFSLAPLFPWLLGAIFGFFLAA